MTIVMGLPCHREYPFFKNALVYLFIVFPAYRFIYLSLSK